MKKYLFMAVTALALLAAQVFTPPAESEVGLLSTSKISQVRKAGFPDTYNGYDRAYEIAETLSVLDGKANGVHYTFDIPGGIAAVTITTHLDGDYAPGGADAYFEVRPVYQYGDATDTTNDWVTIFVQLHADDVGSASVFVCEDSVSGGGAEEIIKAYLLGTRGTRFVMADSIDILVRASTGPGDWRDLTSDDMWKLWVEIVPVSWEVISGGASSY